ncbi:pyruvate oxidase [candidate division GN15 bacterium]|nr:pyruvate oxidase [candidate division GN15 bacterium]
MSQTASDVLVDILTQWGVEVVFGMPGDGANGIMEALRKRRDDIRFVQVRHEEAAAFMATGWAKYTGKLGVCLATSGPGAIHLLNGLYDAKLDGQPVLAITGNQFHDLMRTYGQQDVDIDKAFADVADYNVRVMGPDHIENVAHLACRHATARRSVAHITFPADLQSHDVPGERSHRNVRQHVGPDDDRQYSLPSEKQLREAIEVLQSGDRVAILAGRGALGMAETLEQLSDRLAAPIVKALLGKAAVPDDSPFTTGGLGLLGTEPSQQVMKNCDTLLMIGTSFPYIEFLPEPGTVRAVQIDIDPVRIGLRHPVDVGLVGDSKTVVEALLPMLERREPEEDRKFLQQAQQDTRAWWQLMEERGTRRDSPMKPQVPAWELGKRLPDNAIVAADSGTNTTWWARQIPVKRGQMHTVSGNLASMACAVPYAIAAQIAYPDRPVFAVVGDGGFSMLMAEFATCVKYQLPIKILLIKNDSLGQIKWEQMVFEGNPEYACDLHPIKYADIARACGGSGFVIDDAVKCGAIIDEALNTDGPVLIEAVVDQLEPPMPPEVELGQATQFIKSLVKGEPQGKEILSTILQNRTREMI